MGVSATRNHELLMIRRFLEWKKEREVHFEGLNRRLASAATLQIVRINILLELKRGFAQQQQVVGIGKALKFLPIKTITGGGDISPQNLF
ncbi:hypothetical protein NPIL_114091 [Nephila pilipes]|uniref:Uncharacterized protein n=1 Tax=Nephila pilipes TaxID=299642 RepID=A0A8X6P1Q8_NEPPI|nr:hypothetical protein NPIL_211121 [Nephila pilipes]GFT42546.1 hypothetical protein NPIL_114091 [Nephila pilipes]